MEKTSQDTARASLITKYEERAFDCLTLYTYYGRQFSEMEKGLEDITNRVKKIDEELESIAKLQPKERYSPDNKQRTIALRDDRQKYTERYKGAAEAANKIFQKAAGHREDGIRSLEIIEELKAFSVKTPAEIEADKKAAEAKPAPQQPEQPLLKSE